MIAIGPTADRIGGIESGRLVAYADGALPPEEARLVEADIRDNAEAQEALALMRRSAAAVRHAFDAPLDEPVPERLHRQLERDVAPRSAVQHWRALAASIAILAVGLGAGYLIGRPSDGQASFRLAAGPASTASSAFSAALLQALTAEQPTIAYTDAAHGSTGSITLLGSVETSFGTVCREFRHVADTRRPEATTEGGLACRRANGGWEVAILVPPSSASIP